MKMFFIRHGKDDDSFRGGWSDLDLLLEGRKQTKELAVYLKENSVRYNISYIISSDLRRAMTTSDIIASELVLPVIKEPKIREINNGNLAGMKNEDVIDIIMHIIEGVEWTNKKHKKLFDCGIYAIDLNKMSLI